MFKLGSGWLPPHHTSASDSGRALKSRAHRDAVLCPSVNTTTQQMVEDGFAELQGLRGRKRKERKGRRGEEKKERRRRIKKASACVRLPDGTR